MWVWVGKGGKHFWWITCKTSFCCVLNSMAYRTAVSSYSVDGWMVPSARCLVWCSIAWSPLCLNLRHHHSLICIVVYDSVHAGAWANILYIAESGAERSQCTMKMKIVLASDIRLIHIYIAFCANRLQVLRSRANDVQFVTPNPRLDWPSVYTIAHWRVRNSRHSSVCVFRFFLCNFSIWLAYLYHQSVIAFH